MKILVTGATGFIGSYVIEELLKRNIEVIATSTSTLKAKAKSWFNKVDFIEFELKDYNKLDLYSFFKKPDGIIHLAWRGLPNYNELFHIEEELIVHYNFLKKLISEGLKNVTVTGTCFEYGMQDGVLNEDKNLSNPSNAYSVAKDSLRKFLSLLQLHDSFSLKWLRLFYIYGEGQNPKSLLPQLKLALDRNDQEFNMSQGDQVRDYLQVEVLATYIVAAAIQTKVDGIINISSNTPIKVIDLIKLYLYNMNKSISLNLGHYPYPKYEPFAFWGDNSKLKTIINAKSN